MVSSHHRDNEVTDRITTFDQFRDTIANYRLPRVLLTALELDLFTTIGGGTWTVPALAKKPDSASAGFPFSAETWPCLGCCRRRPTRTGIAGSRRQR